MMADNKTIFEYKLDLNKLIEDAQYMDEDSPEPEFHDAELDELANDLKDAVDKVLEDFLNFRD
jgi:hypothetical protein